MLTMVMANPMQLTMVNAVARDCCGAFCATRVENIGESAMTTMPQNKRNRISARGLDCARRMGEIKQHVPDAANAREATFFGPTDKDQSPPATQARLPIPMTAKAVAEIDSAYWLAC